MICVNRYDERAPRAQRRRMDSEDKKDPFLDSVASAAMDPAPRRRRSQASRVAENDDFSGITEYSRTGAPGRNEAPGRSGNSGRGGGESQAPDGGRRGEAGRKSEYARPRERSLPDDFEETGEYARPQASAQRQRKRPAEPPSSTRDSRGRPAPPSGQRKGKAAPARPQVRKYKDDPDDEYDDDLFDDDEKGSDLPGKRHPLRWIVAILVVIGLLAGITYIGKNRPDLVEGAVHGIRTLIYGPTPEPLPDPTPTPEPEPTPEPLPDVSAAAVNNFSAGALGQENDGGPLVFDINEPVTFQVSTSAETDKVQIVDSNGQVLVQSMGPDDYTEVETGRLWNMMYTFPEPYSGPIEVYPGNASGWNDARGGQIAMLKVAPEQEEAPAGGVAPFSALSAAPLTSVPLTEVIWDKDGIVSSYTRESPIEMGDSDVYNEYITQTGEVREGIRGVLAFRGSNMRANAAYGEVSPVQKKLTPVWTATVGMPMNGLAGFGVQPLLVQWQKQFRERMTWAEEEKANKTSLVEVIFGANDGNLYFFDMDDGSVTRMPQPVDPQTPIFSAASVYPRGIPVLFVGSGDPNSTVQAGDTGLIALDLVDQKQLGIIKGPNEDALSEDKTFLTSAIVDNKSDTMLAVGGNGTLQSMQMNTQVSSEDFSVKLAASIIRFNASADGEDATTRSSLAGYGENVYYATMGGILKCINVNTLQTEWALNLGVPTEAAIALDANIGGDPILYTASLADASGVSRIRSINAKTGDLVWEQTAAGSIKASPLIGQSAFEGLVYFTTAETDGTAIFALNKETGDVVWNMPLNGAKGASPIILYGTDGNGYIVQGDGGGLRLLDALSGTEIDYLQLDAAPMGSPAAYDDMIVVAQEDGKLVGVRLN